jgi:hypothetical protein
MMVVERRQEEMARIRIARKRIRRRGCGIFLMPSMRFEGMMEVWVG